MGKRRQHLGITVIICVDNVITDIFITGVDFCKRLRQICRRVINVSLIEHGLFQIQPVRARIKAGSYLLPICGNLSLIFRTARRAGCPVRPGTGTVFPFCRTSISVLRCVIPFVQRRTGRFTFALIRININNFLGSARFCLSCAALFHCSRAIISRRCNAVFRRCTAIPRRCSTVPRCYLVALLCRRIILLCRCAAVFLCRGAIIPRRCAVILLDRRRTVSRCCRLASYNLQRYRLHPARGAGAFHLRTAAVFLSRNGRPPAGNLRAARRRKNIRQQSLVLGAYHLRRPRFLRANPGRRSEPGSGQSHTT